MQLIIVNYKNKTLRLSSESSQGEQVGPYLAMYLYRYMSFKWLNWTDKRKPSLQVLQEITIDKEWEEYVYSIIVKKGTSEKEIDKIIKELGYYPDYILEKNNGTITLLHQTKYINSLIANGYTLTDTKDGEGNYSFGRGVYCLDKNNFKGIESEWANSNNVYEGVYTGEYLRCIEDLDSDIKSGKIKKFQQEIIIPFTENKIRWKTNN